VSDNCIWCDRPRPHDKGSDRLRAVVEAAALAALETR
jgi:hypothetical protein